MTALASVEAERDHLVQAMDEAEEERNRLDLAASEAVDRIKELEQTLQSAITDAEEARAQQLTDIMWFMGELKKLRET